MCRLKISYKNEKKVQKNKKLKNIVKKKDSKKKNISNKKVDRR